MARTFTCWVSLGKSQQYDEQRGSAMSMKKLLLSLVIALILAMPSLSLAAADAIMGVETATGVPEVLTPSEAASMIGAGGLPSTTVQADETTPVKIYGTGSEASNGWQIGQDSSGNPFINCYKDGAIGNCDYYRKLSSGKKGGFKDSSGNIDFEYTESTGKISAMTVDCEDAGVDCTLYQKLPGCGGDLVAVDALGAASHIWMKAIGVTVPTATAELGVGSGRGVATFPDVDGDYGYEFACLLHPGWSGSLEAKMVFDSSGSGSFVPQIFTKCYGQSSTKDAAWNTVYAPTVTLQTANKITHVTLLSVTSTGCAGGDVLRFKVVRNRTHASDTANAAINIERFELWGRTTY